MREEAHGKTKDMHVIIIDGAKGEGAIGQQDSFLSHCHTYAPPPVTKYCVIHFYNSMFIRLKVELKV